MASKQEWEDYIESYKNNMPAPTPDNIADYAKQWAYLQWLESTYKQYENDWENIPDIIPMTSKAASGIYQSRLDHEFHAVIIAPFSGESTVMAQSDEFTVTVSMETYSGGTLPEVSAEYYEDSQNIGVQTVIVQSGYNVKQNLSGAPYFNDSTYNNGNTGSYFYTCIIYIPKTGTPGEQPQNTFGSAYSFIGTGSRATIGTGGLLSTITGDIDTANPWDYYNNDILPDIDPDNAAFPDGYSPTSPDDPPDEPKDLPHDEGDPPSNQTDRALSVPFNFITQYLLNSEQLMTLGVNLWQSWLTPNTDVWMNFFLPYGQDFGTLNISACMDYLISLRVYPFEFPLEWFVNSPNGLRMGTGHTDFLGTSVAILKSQIYSLDLGTCEVKPETPYNDFRDIYNASVMLYLPYCGTVELNPAEVMYRTLHAYYYIDVQSGGCTAVVTCNGDRGEYNIAAKSGQIGFSIPLTATNAGQLAAQTMKDAVQTVSTIGGFVFDTFGEITKAAGTAASILGSGNSSMGGLPSNLGSKETTLSSSSRMGENMFNTVTSLANQVLDRLSRSGIGMPMLSGGTGAEAMKFPDCVYLQIRRGKYAKPVNYPHSQGHLNGSSNKISYYAGAFKGSPAVPSEYKGKGLCKFAGVDTTGLTCHDDERAEIVALLESGIYI